ncbi:MAG: YggS family pyridoxal phosphate-dependent enzyme [Oscillospiraceae bacterium]|nr:YggS family pyridoxal phosphate-dependent enzyme [Oscillospiraceae bacterium]
MTEQQLRGNVLRVRERISEAAVRAGRRPEEVSLCAATKVQTSETIRAAIRAGISICGENRVQELTAHWEDHAYEGARVDFIGHLQRNKVKLVAGRVDLIHSAASEELLRTISQRAAALELVQDVLLEVNIGREDSKSGFLPEQTEEMAALAAELPGVRLRGLMCIPPIQTVPGGNRRFFSQMWKLYVDIRGKKYDNENDIDCLSMGMSQDFEEAVAEGATLVRVGTALFGPRPPLSVGAK